MSKDDFIILIESLINGDISAEDHERLQKLLKKNPEARTVFRERMDLEASLRTWAAEDIPVSDEAAAVERTSHAIDSISQRGTARKHRTTIAVIAVAVAGIAMLLAGPWLLPDASDSEQLAIDEVPPEQSDPPKRSSELVGLVRQQENCEWGEGLSLAAGQIPTGSLSLISGVAELSFDSGTDVVLEAPCELIVESSNSARLLTGNVVVNVTELSNGFTLYTPEAEIIDLGTEYAVALDEVSTEVHVFDGSVIWKPDVDGTDIEDRIESGEARLYSRSDPTTPKRIPFGQRQFVRRIEAEIKARAGAGLLAYDGFENLAGHLRRGRSGFGWNGGWESGRRGRGQLAEIIDAPDDSVFGMNRAGRRLLLLRNGDSIRRGLEQPVILETDGSGFVSVLIERVSDSDAGEQALQISLGPEAIGRRRPRQLVTFGVTTEGFPFINSGGRITETALRIANREVCLCVIRIDRTTQGTVPMMRVYRAGETVSDVSSSVWTVTGTVDDENELTATHIQLSAGQDANWKVDELRIGTTWRSVIDDTQPE